MSLSIKVASQIRLEPIHKASFYLHGLLKGPISQSSRILRSWEMRTSAWTWQDMQSAYDSTCGRLAAQCWRKNLGIGVSSARVQVLASGPLCS